MAPKRKTDQEADEKKEAPPPKEAKGGLTVGDDLPDLVALETDESTPGEVKKVSLKEALGDKGAVIFVYPKANTGGCTKQACSFNDNVEKLGKAGYQVFGLSADKPKSQANWKAKHKLNFTLLCDPSQEVLKQLGCIKGGKITRSHFVLEKGGKVKDIQLGISPAKSIVEAIKVLGIEDGDDKEGSS